MSLQYPLQCSQRTVTHLHTPRLQTACIRRVRQQGSVKITITHPSAFTAKCRAKATRNPYPKRNTLPYTVCTARNTHIPLQTALSPRNRSKGIMTHLSKLILHYLDSNLLLQMRSTYCLQHILLSQ